jgi:hypothetical protein
MVMKVKKCIKGFIPKEVKKVSKKLFFVLQLVFLCSFILYGCATVQTSSPTRAGDGSEIGTTSPLTSDFEDIPIPSELKKDLNKSFIFETSSIKTAIIYYDSFPGYLDHTSLVNFFKNNMVAHGWKLIDLYNHKESNLTFEKGNRICHITIFDKFLQTKVVVKVGQSNPSKPAKDNQP